MAGWKTGWILDQVDVSIPVVPPVPIVLHRGLNGTGIQDDKDVRLRRCVDLIRVWHSSAGNCRRQTKIMDRAKIAPPQVAPRPGAGELSVAPYKRRGVAGAQCGVTGDKTNTPERANFGKAM